MPSMVAASQPDAVGLDRNPWIGRVLGQKYRLDAELGRGGMGIVFRGLHTLTERPVAVKVLLREFASDQTLGQRFVREAKAAARIRHPNVVDVLDYGVEADGTPYQVIELLDGESLRERLQRGVLPIDRALEIALPLLNALAHAHELGIVHRDLKPDNIFLARNATGRVMPKLLDFGIAKMRTAGVDDPLQTRAGSLMGTPAYMSPEQASGQADVGAATDIWSMGAILFECLSGEMLFHAETLPLLLSKIIVGPAPRANDAMPSLPLPLAQAIDRALRQDPQHRFATAREMENEIRIAATASGVNVPAYDASDFRPTGRPPDAPVARAGTPFVSMSTIPASVDQVRVPETADLLAGSGPSRGLVASTHPVETSTERPIPRARSRTPVLMISVVGVAAAVGITAWVTQSPDSTLRSAPTGRSGAIEPPVARTRLEGAEPKPGADGRETLSPPRAAALPESSPLDAAVTGGLAEHSSVEPQQPVVRAQGAAEPDEVAPAGIQTLKRNARRTGARPEPGVHDPPPLAGW